RTSNRRFSRFARTPSTPALNRFSLSTVSPHVAPGTSRRCLILCKTVQSCQRLEMRKLEDLGCPLWVKGGHQDMRASCPLCPQKRTWVDDALMSALCQKQTFC